MKRNSGFSLVECILTISLMAIAFSSILTYLYLSKRKSSMEAYFIDIYNNKYAIVNLFDANPSHFIENLEEEYSDQIIIESGRYFITFSYIDEMLNINEYVFCITFNEGEEYYELITTIEGKFTEEISQVDNQLVRRKGKK